MKTKLMLLLIALIPSCAPAPESWGKSPRSDIAPTRISGNNWWR